MYNNRVWETGKQFVWFGHLRLASLLPLEGAVKEAHYLLLGILTVLEMYLKQATWAPLVLLG